MADDPVLDEGESEVFDHFCVASETAIGCRTTATNDASGKSAWRKRKRIKFGGDFSTRTRRAVSQCGAQAASIGAEHFEAFALPVALP